jgi:membrane protease YdiL (CAAX protease family)
MLPLAMDVPPPPADVVRRPRVWTVFCALLVAIVAALLAAGIASLVFLAVAPDSPGFHADQHEIMRWLGGSVAGVCSLIVPAQLSFFVSAAFAALLSPQRWSERLALRAPVVGALSTALLLAGTLGVLGVVMALAPLLGEPTEGMQDVAALLGSTRGGAAVAVTLVVGLLPGTCEELLFRGYAQTRFVQRFGALRGIVLAAVFFALAHFDWQHVTTAFCVGLWMGTVAWLTRSTWVSMAAHALNNIAALATMHAIGATDEIPWSPLLVACVAVLLALGVFGVVRARRRVPQ